MKILKNTTLVDIELRQIGQTIPAESQSTINIEDYIILASNDSVAEIDPLIVSGDIIINDGTNDLNVIIGKAYIRYPDDAENILFDNASNGFISKTVQTAIEETMDAALTDQFSYHRIPSGKIITIPTNQQMTVHGIFTINGQLNIDGCLILGD